MYGFMSSALPQRAEPYSCALAVFLGVFAFAVDNQPDKPPPTMPKQIKRDGGWGQGTCKGSGEALPDMQQLCGISAPAQAGTPVRPFKQIDKEQIREIQ